LSLAEEIGRTQVVIMAAGAGLRFGTNSPKMLAVLNGKTLLQRCIEPFVADGFRRFTLILGWRAPVLAEHAAKIFGSTPYQVHVEPDDHGKAAALRNALFVGKLEPRLRSILIFPDDLYTMPGLPSYVLTNHTFAVTSWKAQASVVLAPGYGWPFGSAELAPDGRVSMFEEKPFIRKPSSTGFYVLEPWVQDLVLDEEGLYDLERELLPRLAKEGLLNGVLIPHGAWIPINTQPDYARAVRILSGNPEETKPGKTPWPD
jgi:NDP-sugar pyrophosphorylase family protein